MIDPELNSAHDLSLQEQLNGFVDDVCHERVHTRNRWLRDPSGFEVYVKVTQRRVGHPKIGSLLRIRAGEVVLTPTTVDCLEIGGFERSDSIEPVEMRDVERFMAMAYRCNAWGAICVDGDRVGDERIIDWCRENGWKNDTEDPELRLPPNFYYLRSPLDSRTINGICTTAGNARLGQLALASHLE